MERAGTVLSGVIWPKQNRRLAGGGADKLPTSFRRYYVGGRMIIQGIFPPRATVPIKVVSLSVFE